MMSMSACRGSRFNEVRCNNVASFQIVDVMKCFDEHYVGWSRVKKFVGLEFENSSTMSKDSGEKKSGDHHQSKKGKGIVMYQRKKYSHNKKATALPSKQHAPPPEITVTGWADANSGHLLTCACRVCTGGAPTPLFRSNIIAPRRPERDCPAGFVPPPQPVPGHFRANKVSKGKVYPSVVIPPSSNEPQKTSREIPLPKMEDISFIELLASGSAPSQPAISFMDMLQNGKKVADGCNFRQRFVEKLNGLNYFMKMVMEEEGGVDDEQLFREVKQELMIREVDAYACLLRKENLDFGKVLMTTN
nr:hypothetical protein Iba_chr02bCG8500 [Ipomoea batatas]